MRVCFLFILFSLCKVSLAQRVGINTGSPTSILDVNGDVRIRTITNSTDNNDSSVVVDTNGLIKKRRVIRQTISATNNQVLFRGYLNRDFISSTESSAYRINNFNVIANPNNNFNTGINLFTAPVTGQYRITITLTFRNNITSRFTDFTTGLAISRNALPITRFLIKKSITSSDTTGTTCTFMSTVSLTANETYFFFTGGGTTILANPTGSGIGTFFEIELLSN